MEFLVQNAMKTAEAVKDNTGNAVGIANIKVIGCGGGGNNAVDWLHKKGVEGAEIIAINTDKQHLDFRDADKKILIINYLN